MRCCRPLLPMLVALLLLAGCKDAPTMPAALQHLAGGERWVAIPAPRDVPGLSSWVPYIDRDTEAGRSALARVTELTRQAEAARSAGRLAAATALEVEAERVAVLSLSRFPEPARLQRSLFALDAWRNRVQADVALDGAPEMAIALRRVSDARAAAASMLAAGDTTSAVLLLAEASEVIRDHAPTAVALRVLERVEQRLRSDPTRSSAVERALRLLSASRQELLSGDPGRALRRALYALQLADGAEIPVAADPQCLGPGC